MSVEAISLVLNHSKATGIARLVMVGIANHYGDGGAWPSVETLARYAGVQPRAVQKRIAELIELGEIVRHLNDGGTHKTPDHVRPNRYEITLTCPADCDRSPWHKPLVQGTPPVPRDTSPLSHGTPLPLSHGTPETAVETEEKRQTRKRVPIPLPAEFEPSVSLVTWARSELPGIDTVLETKKFCLYWRGKKKADWDATWRNWMLNAATYQRERRQRMGLPDNVLPIKKLDDGLDQRIREMYREVGIEP